MSTLIRLALGVLCLGVLALGVVVFDPARLLTSPAPWEPNPRGSMAEELSRREQLNQFFEASYRRVKAKRQIAKEVIAGQRSLAEAIAWFRALDREWPENHPWHHAPAEHAMSEDEWDGRMVIDQVRQVLVERPDEAAIARLETELQELLANEKKRPLAPVDSRTERSG